LITHYGTSARVEEISYSLWTADEFKRIDYRGNALHSEPNIYRVIPFLPVWDRLPTDSFWCAGGDDLIALQEAINLKLTDLMYTLEHQAFGVGWISGMTGAGKLRVDPGHMVLLPQDGKLGYANTNAPIEEVVAAIDKLVKWAAVSNGLPASSLSTEPTDESGLSKLVSNRELDELRRDDVALFRRHEGQLFDLMRVVWNAHNPTRKFSDKAKLRVDFYDPKPQMSANEQAQAWERLSDLGVINAVDIALEHNPDLKTRENALAHLLSLQDERAQLEEKQL
ncbi:MAG: phage portal protein, partial [Pseudomonadota bacterium]